jgi:hypothetical protein
MIGRIKMNDTGAIYDEWQLLNYVDARICSTEHISVFILPTEPLFWFEFWQVNNTLFFSQLLKKEIEAELLLKDWINRHEMYDQLEKAFGDTNDERKSTDKTDL